MRGFLGRLLSLGLCALSLTVAGFFSEAPACSQDQDSGPDEVSTSVLGNYLAGPLRACLARYPGRRNVLRACAQSRSFKRSVARSGLPDGNDVWLNWPKAIPLAEQLASTPAVTSYVAVPSGRVGLQERGDYSKAEDHFKAASENPIGELTSAIALGWTSPRGRRR